MGVEPQQDAFSAGSIASASYPAWEPRTMRIAPRAVLLVLAASMSVAAAEAPDPRGMFDVVPPTPPAPKAQAPAPALDPNLLDQVPLKNRQRLFGTILSSSTDQVLDLNTGSGVLRIPVSQVDQEHLVYGLASRRARLQSDTLPELIAFAAWCEEHGYRADALSALARAATMPDADAEVLGKLAHLIDLSAGAEQALPLYRKYQAAGGKDPDLLARLAQLETTLQAHNELLAAQNEPPLVIGGTGAALAMNPPPAAAPKAGMEARGWRPEDPQWSLPVTTQVTSIPDDDGTVQVLAIASPGKADAPAAPGKRAPDKVAVRRLLDLAVEDASVLTFRLRNRGEQPVKIAFAVKTSDQWRFFESKQIQVSPSDAFKTVKFDLKDSTFKSEATHWLNSGTIQDLSQVKEVQLLVYNQGAAVDLVINNMQLVKDSEM
jgi:hypothetical protein